MTLLSKFLCAAGVAGILFGAGSWAYYYLVNPPPEASLPGSDTAELSEPYLAFGKFFLVIAGGVFTLCIGLYLRGRAHRINSRHNEPGTSQP